MDVHDVCKQILVSVVVLMFLLRIDNSFADPATLSLVSSQLSVLTLCFFTPHSFTMHFNPTFRNHKIYQTFFYTFPLKRLSSAFIGFLLHRQAKKRADLLDSDISNSSRFFLFLLLPCSDFWAFRFLGPNLGPFVVWIFSLPRVAICFLFFGDLTQICLLLLPSCFLVVSPPIHFILSLPFTHVCSPVQIRRN